MAKAAFEGGVVALTESFPLGTVTVRLGSRGRVEKVEFGPRDPSRRSRSTHPVARALRDYLAGRSRSFDVPVCGLVRYSAFDREVWRAARAIPPGQTRTYGQVAAAIGRPGAARAVGGALGRNPVPLAVPCHRVVAAGGALGGFSSGLALKRWLLRLEGGAAPPAAAEQLYCEFTAALGALGVPVRNGVFRAQMKMALVNDGPVTVMLKRTKGEDER